MFEVQYGSEKREQRIRGFLEQEPPAAVILAAVHFEWTLRRAIIGLGENPNVAIREGLKGCHGLDSVQGGLERRVGSCRQERASSDCEGLAKAQKGV